jgi:hypothetical protein
MQSVQVTLLHPSQLVMTALEKGCTPRWGIGPLRASFSGFPYGIYGNKMTA